MGRMRPEPALQVQKEGFKCTRHLRRIFATSTLIAVVLVFLVTLAWAENYSSSDSKYPGGFINDVFDTERNGVVDMDAVYFGGKEIVFFTLFSSSDSTATSQLYFYTSDSLYNGSRDIGNSEQLDFRFKTCVFNNVLYLFYTPSESAGSYNAGTIYYRTVTVDRGAGGTAWDLVFSEQKSFPSGVSSVTLSMAGSMNGTMYIVYSNKTSSGYDWYYISAPDGLTFGREIKLFTSADERLYGAGGAIFQVPDPSKGCVEELMLAYCVGNGGNNSLKYFFLRRRSGLWSKHGSDPWPVSLFGPPDRRHGKRLHQ